jgi:phage shock protein PspC (stress-responsive transcriptional regulator)
MKEQLLTVMKKTLKGMDNHIALRFMLLFPLLAIVFIIVSVFTVAFFVVSAYLMIKEVILWFIGYPERNNCCCENCDDCT